MTAPIIFEPGETLEAWELGILGVSDEMADGDAHAIDVQGNVLGAGELWERIK